MAYRATRSEKRVLSGRIVELIKGRLLALSPWDASILLSIGSVERVPDKPKAKPKRRRRKKRE